MTEEDDDDDESMENSIFTLIIRLIVGFIFVYHGGRKLVDLQSWNSFIEDKVKIPFAGIGTSLLEILIGLFLIFGLFTRITAGVATLFMIIAIILVYSGKPVFEYYYELAIILLGIILLFMGGGNYSLDNVVFTNKK